VIPNKFSMYTKKKEKFYNFYSSISFKPIIFAIAIESFSDYEDFRLRQSEIEVQKSMF